MLKAFTFALVFSCTSLSLAQSDEIAKSLTDNEKLEIKKMEPIDQEALMWFIEGRRIMTKQRDDLRGISKGEFFRIGESINIDQIIDKGSFIGFGQSIYVSGVDTSDLADDQDVKFGQNIKFYCPGNATYPTVLGGSRTIKKADAVDIQRAAGLAKAICESRGFQAFGESASQFDFAKLDRITKSIITVQRLGSKKPTTIQRKSLSEEDNAWVDDQQAKRKEEAKHLREQKLKEKEVQSNDEIEKK